MTSRGNGITLISNERLAGSCLTFPSYLAYLSFFGSNLSLIICLSLLPVVQKTHEQIKTLDYPERLFPPTLFYNMDVSPPITCPHLSELQEVEPRVKFAPKRTSDDDFLDALNHVSFHKVVQGPYPSSHLQNMSR